MSDYNLWDNPMPDDDEYEYPIRDEQKAKRKQEAAQRLPFISPPPFPEVFDNGDGTSIIVTESEEKLVDTNLVPFYLQYLRENGKFTHTF